MERGAADYDIKTCPLCGSRDGLVIRWLPDINHRVHEVTEVGCAKCGKFFSGKEDRFVFADWNLFAIEEFEQRGVREPHTQLHRLLHECAKAEKIAVDVRAQIDAYLEEHIAPTCPFGKGDRFRAVQYPRGVWSVQAVKAVYGYNTGPFWIVSAVNVLPSGRLGDKTHEFWQKDLNALRRLVPFWKPHTWRQVVPGDQCMILKQRGLIRSVDRSSRTASIALGDQLIEIRRLQDLEVPNVRVECDGT